MDSTLSTTQPSRSPSPSTPEPSDALDPVTIQGELDLTSSWYLSGVPTTRDNVPPWVSDPVYTAQHKMEDDQMLRLDELIERHAYDESPPSEFNSSLSYSSPPSYSATSSPPPHTETAIPDFRASSLLVPSRSGPVTMTKPIPPPASLPRKQDPSTINQIVTHPPKESCLNLPIMFPSIPEGGTKSRVETQIRVTIDLADPSSSSDPFKYNRVGSWKWLKLPHGTTTKKRTRKQGKIDPKPQDVLHLVTSVTCSSSPHSAVLSCSSCQAREAKRVAKKLAARVRPARSDSESEVDGNGKQGKQSTHKQHHEDTTSIIQFNCAEVLDFSTGTVVLPLRLTCYCRHHREKVGFTVHFSMLDNSGRVVGTGMSRPIMITDDHKTSSNKPSELINNFTALDQPDWSQVGGALDEILPIMDLRAPSKRKELSSSTANNTKKRPKPYDSNGKPNRISREASVASQPSPPTAFSSLSITSESTPSSMAHNMIPSPGPANPPPLHHPMQGSETSSPDSLATPLDQSSDVHISEVNLSLSDTSPIPPHSLSSSNMTIQPSHSMSFMFFDRTLGGQGMAIQVPTIHRFIPNTGPTHGGIEVTVLGANFHSSVSLNCVFGDVTASSTQRWSDNTLVCVLPPRATPGVVAVWFEGFPKTEDQLSAPPSLFTYSDESDRALMELALQVVGLKMTGKIEDAKNVAMRIVGNAGGDGSDSQGGNNNNVMQLAPLSTTRDLRPLLFARAGENDNFESLIVDFLAIINTPLDNSTPDSISTLDAISYASASGQTLLHFASFLGFPSLTTFLVKHGADLDARDRNGFTPLHFAAISRSSSCASILVEAGADLAIVNVLGKTSKEIAVPGFFDDILPTEEDSESDRESSGGDLGDAEDEDLQISTVLRRRILRRTSRLNIPRSGKNTPRRSVDVSRAATPIPDLDDKENKSASTEEDIDAADAKRAASFMEKMIQRTLAQFLAPQGIIPQLPLPHLPHLPDLRAVPWGALPQIPLVFPVFVPVMPGWPSFLGGDHAATVNADKPGGGGDDATRNMGNVALRAAHEWRTTWEKWIALVIATTPRQQTEDLPPPVYTPRAAESEFAQVSQETLPLVAEALASTSTRLHPSEIRPLGYDSTPVPEQVIESFGVTKPTQKLEKKHDRMLLLFWLPILLLSMLWAFHTGVRFAFHTIKMALPVKTPLRS